MLRIAPSLFAANFLEIGRELERLAEAGVDQIHYDVMDGAFVPNFSFGSDMLKTVASYGIPVDVHLMIRDPDRYVDEFARAGAACITVHAEACPHLHRTLQHIRETGAMAGVAMNPGTAPTCLRYVADETDLALVMAVDPGCRGQKLLPHMARKVRETRRLLDEAGSKALIEVDGGMALGSCGEFIRSGVDIMVIGRALFSSGDMASYVREIRAADAREARRA